MKSLNRLIFQIVKTPRDLHNYRMNTLYMSQYMSQRIESDIRLGLKEQAAVAIAEETEIVVEGITVAFFPIVAYQG